jgi:Pyruvate/2-oxoacid:ferredoxin oxidoreductase delta subunit
LTHRDYTHDHLLKLSNQPPETFQPALDVLIKKGFIMVNVDQHAGKLYGLSPILVGWIEMADYFYTGTPEEIEYISRLDRIFRYFTKMNIYPVRNLANRFGDKIVKAHQEVLLYQPKNGKKTIPIDKTMWPPVYEIHPHKTINDLIEERADSIYLLDCVCRKAAKGMGRPCAFDVPTASCLFFGDRGIGYTVAKYSGVGKKIEREEALDVLQAVSEKGAVHSVFHEKDDPANRSETVICNCCLDCCGLLRSYNMGGMPVNYRCFYYASVKDISKCTGCGKCVKHCPGLAISLKNGKVHINKDRCIGCAQCTLKCTGKGVLTMVRETRDVMLPLLKKEERRFAG